MSETVRIHYHRPPDRTELFEQELLYQTDDVSVTYLASTPLERPLVVDGEVALQNGSPVIWFTFPGRMHDVGRFHTAAGTFTGVYANILMPVEMVSKLEWRAVDLFLDIWIGAQGEPRLLDEAELDHALRSGWLTPSVARNARAEAARLMELHKHGDWPPAVVNEWTLERVIRRS